MGGSSTLPIVPTKLGGARYPRLEEESMHAETSATQPHVQAICAAVGPHGWRALTAEMVVRRLLGAADRLLVLEGISATQGESARDLTAIEPAERDDDRL